LSFVRGEGFTSGFTKYVRNAANVTSYDGSATEHNLVSFFSRANMSYGSRYLFSLSARADGSSRFGADNRYGIFPSASIGWNVTEETFAAPLARLATLKLRASYGLTGNEGIGDFAALGLAAGAPYSGIPGIAPTTFANPDLRWETTRELDTGVDLALFGGRATIIADYYDRSTEDLLVQRPIPLTSGFSSIWDNVGTIRNRGVDLGLNTVNISPANDGGFRWSSDLNVTFNRNDVLSLYDDQQFVTGINGRETSLVTVGQPLGVFYMYKFDGVDPATGDAIIRDVDGDGDVTSSDRMVVGSPHPDYFGGFGNTFSFGNLELRTFLDFSQGNQLFNMMRIFTDDGGCTWDNLSSDVMKRWQKPGDITDMPRMSYDCTSGADLISSRFIEDGSYVRLGEITLGLRLPAAWAGRAGMESARVYVSGRNLKTWTDYSGYNPTVNSAGSDANVIMGTDYYAYPLARTFTFGISAGW
jgi:TonB-linked SusC/RagA family outer membrane protein